MRASMAPLPHRGALARPARPNCSRLCSICPTARFPPAISAPLTTAGLCTRRRRAASEASLTNWPADFAAESRAAAEAVSPVAAYVVARHTAALASRTPRVRAGACAARSVCLQSTIVALPCPRKLPCLLPTFCRLRSGASLSSPDLRSTRPRPGRTRTWCWPRHTAAESRLRRGVAWACRCVSASRGARYGPHSRSRSPGLSST